MAFVGSAYPAPPPSEWFASPLRSGWVAEPLVLYRVGAGAYRRRGGLAQLRTELGLQRRLHALGFTTTRQYLRNVVVRGGYRLVPEAVRKVAYRRLVAPYGERRRVQARQ